MVAAVGRFCFSTMDTLKVNVFEPLKQFSKDSVMLIRKCTKPDMKGPALKYMKGL